MNISPLDFSRMRMSDFLIKWEGFNERVSDDNLLMEAIARKQTFIIAQSMGAKLHELNKTWDDPFDPPKRKKLVRVNGIMMSEFQAQMLAQKKKDRLNNAENE